MEFMISLRRRDDDHVRLQIAYTNCVSKESLGGCEDSAKLRQGWPLPAGEPKPEGNKKSSMVFSQEVAKELVSKWL